MKRQGGTKDLCLKDSKTTKIISPKNKKCKI